MRIRCNALLLVALCALTIATHPAGAAIVRVQATKNVNPGPSASTVSTPSPITLTTGNTVVIWAAWGYQTSATIDSVGDVSNSYTAIGSIVCEATTGCGQMFYKCSVTGGSLSPTVNLLGSAGGLSIAVHEYSGMDTSTSSSCYDKVVSATGATGANSQSVASTTPTSDGSLVLAGHLTNTDAWTGITAGSTFTLDQGQALTGADVGAYSQTQYVIQTTKTATTAPITSSNGGGVGWVEVVVMFNAAAGGGGGGGINTRQPLNGVGR